MVWADWAWAEILIKGLFSINLGLGNLFRISEVFKFR